MKETPIIELDTQKTFESLSSLRKKLREVKDEMTNLEAGSDAFLAAAKKAGELQHQIDDITKAVRGASSDFGDMLGNVTKIGAGISGAFQTAQAALSMFGVESEEVIKSIKTMQNLMAMTQGLAAIDSSIKAMNKLRNAIQGASVVAKVLRTALQPKVFIAITAAITVLVGIWKKFGDNIKETIPLIGTITKWFSDLTTDAAETAKEIANIDTEINNLKESLASDEVKQRLLKMNSEARKSYQELADSVSNYDKQLKIVKLEQDKLKKEYDSKGWTAEAKKKWQELNQQGIDYLNTISLLKKQQQALLDDENSYKAITKSTVKENKTKVEQAIKLTDFTMKQYEYERMLVAGKREELDVVRKMLSYQTQVVNNAEQEKLNAEAAYRANKNKLELLKNVEASSKDYNEALIQQARIQTDLNNTTIKYYSSLSTTVDIKHAINELTAYVGTVEKVESILNRFNEEGNNYDVRRNSILTDRIFGTKEALEKKAEELKIPASVLEGIVYMLKSNELDLLKLESDAMSSPLTMSQQLNQELTHIDDKIKLMNESGIENIEHSKEYLNLLIRRREIEGEIAELNNEQREVNRQYQEDTYFQMTNGIKYLEIRLGLEEEILATLQQGSLEYDIQQKKIQGLKNSVIDMKFAFSNVASQGISYMSDMLQSFADLQDETTEEGFKKQKALAKASVVFNIASGIMNAWNSWMSAANAWMTAPVQAAMATAQSIALGITGAAQIAQIDRTEFGGGASISTGSVNTLTMVPPVDYTNLTQNAAIEDSVSNTKTYVSVEEINRVGKRVEVAENESVY